MNKWRTENRMNSGSVQNRVSGKHNVAKLGDAIPEEHQSAWNSTLWASGECHALWAGGGKR